jgi:hypothetical protein
VNVEVYRNLNTGTLSVRRTGKGGKVFSRPLVAFVRDPKLVVQPAGRERVLKEKRKNVHAFVRGEHVRPADVPLELLREFHRRSSKLWRKAVYNPYDAPTFVDTMTRQPVTEASYAVVTTRGVFYR